MLTVLALLGCEPSESASGAREDASAVNASSDASDAGGSAWSPRAPLPGAQQESSVLALGGKVWVIGGFGAARQVVSSVLVYDPSTDRWQQGPSLPEPLHHTNAIVVGDAIYVAGALRGTDFTATGSVYRLASGATTWEARTSMPLGSARGASFVGAIDGKIYVAGGLRGGSAVADVSVYETTADAWAALPPLPSPRDHGASAVVGGKLYAIGGRGGVVTTHTNEVLAFDPANNQWTTRAPMPTSRGGCMAAVVGDRIIVLGGEGNPRAATGVFEQTERYDPASDRWDTLERMRTPRHGTGAAAVGGVVFVPGGATVQAFGATSVVEAFVP